MKAGVPDKTCNGGVIVKLFLDTANIQEIRDGARLGVISGVTTNPSLASAEGIGNAESYKTAVREISDIVDGPISVEVISLDAKGMIAEGRDIAGWIPNPWVKIPSTADGFEAISVLSSEGIKVNQTLCFSVNQALLGAQAGSTHRWRRRSRSGRRGAPAGRSRSAAGSGSRAAGPRRRVPPAAAPAAPADARLTRPNPWLAYGHGSWGASPLLPNPQEGELRP